MECPNLKLINKMKAVPLRLPRFFEFHWDYHNLWRTIVKLVMCCSSSSSSDSSAKTNQRAFRVYLAVEVTNDSQIIHNTVLISKEDALATQHVQGAPGNFFSDMIRENDNSESCHVLFFRFFW